MSVGEPTRHQVEELPVMAVTITGISAGASAARAALRL